MGGLRQSLVFSDIPGNTMHRGEQARPRPRSTASRALVERLNAGFAETGFLVCEQGGRGRRGALRDGRTPQRRWPAPGSRKDQQPERTSSSTPHGAIFFHGPAYGVDSGRTPPFGKPGQKQDLDFQGVYRIDLDGSLHLAVREGFTQPNGLAFSPDESVLYIGDSQERMIWRYQVTAGRELGDRKLFVDQRGDPRRGAPDGMNVDSDGRLWTTGAGGVSVHSAAGEYLGVFETEEHAANLTFGGDGFSTLFLTSGTSVFAVETTVRGVVPGSR